MNNDIVDRLRYVCSCESQGVCTWCDGADEIVRLRARVTDLEAQNARLNHSAETWADDYGELHDLYTLRRRKHNDEAALADQLAEAARLIAETDIRTYKRDFDPNEILWDRVHPTVQEVLNAKAALAAREAARRETP